MRRLFVFIGCVTCFSVALSPVLAQVANTESPYSHFGLGDFALVAYSRAAGMGGISQGLRDKNQVNPFNPASYTRQDTMSFILDIAMRGNITHYQSSLYPSRDHGGGNVHHIAMQFPIGKYVGMAVGFQPFTQMGFDVTRYETNVKILSDVGRVRYRHRGSGGTNQAFLGLAVQPFKFLSVGVNASYVFGSLNFSQDLFVPHNPLYAQVQYVDRTVVRGLDLLAGIQFHYDFADEGLRNLTLGATCELFPVMRESRRMEAKQLYVGREVPVANNLRRSSGILNVPRRYAAGGLFSTPHWSVGLDASFQDWSSFEMRGEQPELGKSYSIRAGAQLIPNPDDLRHYLNRVSYRFGAYFGQLPIAARGKSLYEYGVTLGFGFPYKYTGSMFHVALKCGRRGTKENNLVRETYLELLLGVSLNDIWFFKRQYD